jgi:opacity protein-like surface antigen
MTESKTRTFTYFVRAAAMAALVAVAAPAAAQNYRPIVDNSFRLRLGQFEPQGESRYWDDNFDVFTGGIEQFDDISFGGDFILALSGRHALMFSGDIYEGEDSQAYIDFVDELGSPIVHDTRLTIASATVAYVFSFTGRDASVVPYVGVGGGIYAWELEESGDFIDFGVNPPEIFTDTFRDSNTALGYFYLAGVEVPVGTRWSVLVEGRWQELDQELGDDFETLGDIDLSGRHIYGGFAWRF